MYIPKLPCHYYFFSQCVTTKGVPFFVNSISSIIGRCVGNPHTSLLIQRFPVVPKGPYRYMTTIALLTYDWDNREMFHASRWHDDPRFHSPMTLLNNGEHVFLRDCVSCVHPVLLLWSLNFSKR